MSKKMPNTDTPPDQARKPETPPGQRKKIDAAIAHRLVIALEDVETIRLKASIIKNPGGPHGDYDLIRRVEFHEGRVRLLRWMQDAALDQIEAKIADIEAALGPACAIKGGSMVGVPDDTVRLIAHLEILEYGIGAHALQQKVSAV